MWTRIFGMEAIKKGRFVKNLPFLENLFINML